MNNRFLAGLTMVFILLAFANIASASIITFEEYSITDPVTSISTEYSHLGVEFISETGFLTTGAGIPLVGTNGPQFLGFIGNPQTDPLSTSAKMLFDSPVKDLSLDISNSFFGGDSFSASVYDADSVLIETITFDFSDLDNGLSWKSINFTTESEIAFLEWEALGTTTFAYAVDNIQWENTATPVPEPNTALLLGCGLIGLAGIVRKKKS